MANYLPKHFEPKLPSGKSLLEGREGSRGRTRRERKKQAERFNRIRKRSADDMAAQKKVGK